ENAQQADCAAEWKLRNIRRLGMLFRRCWRGLLRRNVCGFWVDFAVVKRELLDIFASETNISYKINDSAFLGAFIYGKFNSKR
ncbi:MAG: hypothetical protein FWG68_10030, partial [Defluviitaleaceae bacterium]|nr:hypothetical protein [Defluviitaleaceae bacterium]